MAKVRIPLTLYCRHYDNAKDEVKFVPMKVSIIDKEVPSYEAKCPQCGKDVVFDFDGGLA